MLSHKLLLDEVEEDYKLIAIHSSLEEYKLAYYLNKYLRLYLQRARTDLDFNHGLVQALYPLYVFKEPAAYRVYYLIKNRYKGPVKKVISSGSLFLEEEVSPKVTYLIPECKQVDYFLKIKEDMKASQVQKLLNSITMIPNVIAAYMVDVDQLKSKNNLILE